MAPALALFRPSVASAHDNILTCLPPRNRLLFGDHGASLHSAVYAQRRGFTNHRNGDCRRLWVFLLAQDPASMPTRSTLTTTS